MPLDTFGGGVTHPSDVSYRLIVLDQDLVLQWPSLSETENDVVARTMEVQPQDAGFSITFPDASAAALGQDILIRNTGDSAVTIKDATGNSIATVNAGEVKYFYLTGNTSKAGSWGVFLFGVGASSADASLLAGLGLKVIGTTLNQAYAAVETTSDLNISSSDRAKLYVYTGGSHDITLPTSASVGSDFFFIVKNAGAGTITVLPAGNDTIDGSSSLLVQPNDGVIFFSGGNSSKWYSVAQGRSVQFAFTQLVKNVGGATGDIVLSSSEAQNKVMTFTGTLVQSINVIVPDTVSVYYVFNNTQGAFSLSVKTASGAGIAVTQGAREIAVCDGSDVRRGVDNTSATTLFSEGSESAPSITFVTDTDSGIYHPAANQVGITAGGTDVMRFSGVSGGVNAFQAFSSASGDPVKLTVIGDDANGSMLFKAKGAGEVLFEDVDLTFRNSADATKKVRFDVSGVATNTKRTVSFPDATGEMVLDTAAQTLSNKTFQSALFSGNEPADDLGAPAGLVTICPAGVVLPFAGPNAPTGWFFCYGQEVSRVDYARLFGIIGTTYGSGDGATTFNLPDMRGCVPAGLDNMGGTAASRLTSFGASGQQLGARGGEQDHALTQDENGPHNHTLHDPGHTHGGGLGANGGTGQSGCCARTDFNAANVGSSVTGITIDASGAGTPHNNVQPTVLMNYIIKA